MLFIVVVLPAVAAKQRHHLAFPHLEIDAVQDVAFAVPGVQIAYLEHPALRHAPCPGKR